MKRHVETRARARQLRADLTTPERKLWNAIRANRIGVKFQRQVVLPPYIADFAARSERVVIEVDGDTHGERAAYDAVRTKSLEQRGYRVIRITNADVMSNLDGVLRFILIALGRDPESPRPLRGERESGGEAETGRGEREAPTPLSPRR
jgi:very-short-patch-repair endonuclease